MRIAFFTDTYHPNHDGVVRAIDDFKAELTRRGDSVFVVSSGTLGDRRVNTNRDVQYHTSLRLPPYPQYKVALFPYPRSLVACQRRRIELVHSHGLGPMGVASVTTAKALRLPLVGTFHTLLPQGVRNYTKRPRVADFLERSTWRALSLFYKPFDVVTAPSKVMCELLDEHGVEGARVVPNAVDSAKFKPSASRSWLEKKTGRKGPFVLSLGRVSHEKNIPLVIDAFAEARRELGGGTLVVAGGGPQLAELKALKPSNVVFTGFVEERDLAKYYSAADAFVSASTFETQGLALLEAMACGTPVAGADSLAIPEVVKTGKNGYLFEANEIGACAEAIVKAASAKKKLSSACRATALKYSVGKCTDELVKAYAKAL